MALHTVEIRPDRGSENTPEASSQIFSSLASIKTSFLNRLLGREEPIVFEILSYEQKTHFFAHFPLDYCFETRSPCLDGEKISKISDPAGIGMTILISDSSFACL